MTRQNQPEIILFWSWLLIFATIPLLSIFGRPLHRWLITQLATRQLAVFLGITLSLLFVAIVSYMVKVGGKKQLWHLLWLAVLFVFIQLYIPIVEERVHVILFGLFGFVTLRLFPLPWGIFLCVLVSASDELLQFFLAARVGDWHDVFLNLLSTGLGAVLAKLSQIADNPLATFGKAGRSCE